MQKKRIFSYLYVMVIAAIFSTGCTLYESYGRKQFEGHPEEMNEASGSTTNAANKTQNIEPSCEVPENYESVFKSYEFFEKNKVAESNEAEGWMIVGAQGSPVVFIKLFFDESSQLTQSCSYSFANEKDFYKSGLIESFSSLHP